MFQTRFGNQLLYSDLDACEVGGRDVTTRMLVRKVNIHDQQRESSQNPEHALLGRKKHTQTLALCNFVVERCNKFCRWSNGIWYNTFFNKLR